MQAKQLIVAAGAVGAALALAGAAVSAPTWTAPVPVAPGFDPSVAVDPAGDAVVVFTSGIVVNTVSRQRGAEKWTSPVTIAEGGSAPDVAVDAAGDAFAVFTTGAWPNRHFQARFRPGASAAWQDVVTLSPAPETTGGDIAVNRAGDAVVGLTGWAGRGYVAQASVRPAASSRWQQAVDLSDPEGNSPRGTAVAIDDAGNALALWVRAGQVADNPVVLSSFRPMGGPWAAPVELGGPYGDVSRMEVEFDAAGNAVAAWTAHVPSSGDLVYASYRPAGGSWTRAASVSSSSQLLIRDLSLVVDDGGNAVALWIEVTPGVQAVVKAASRPAASGAWQPAVQLSPTSGYAGAAALASDGAGNAVAVWTEGLADATVHAALRPAASGSWESLVQLASGAFGSDVAVAIDERGGAVALWERSAGPTYLVESSDLKAGGPVLAQLEVPAKATVGVAARFRVTPAAWGSPLVGEPTWQFGDGTSARGRRVAQAYRRAGSYVVTVTQPDTSGRTSTSTATIRVERAALTNRRVPVVAGSPRVGATLTCRPGSWSGTQPIRFRYAWLRAGTPIGSATGPRYRVRPRDSGAVLSCRVTATNGARTLAAVSRPVRVRAR